MRKALTALLVCGVMISAFVMTSVASAQSTPAGNSPVYKFKSDVEHATFNSKQVHRVAHTDPGVSAGPYTGPVNQNSNNPNDNGYHPAANVQ